MAEETLCVTLCVCLGRTRRLIGSGEKQSEKMVWNFFSGRSELSFFRANRTSLRDHTTLRPDEESKISKWNKVLLLFDLWLKVKLEKFRLGNLFLVIIQKAEEEHEPRRANQTFNFSLSLAFIESLNFQGFPRVKVWRILSVAQYKRWNETTRWWLKNLKVFLLQNLW